MLSRGVKIRSELDAPHHLLSQPQVSSPFMSGNVTSIKPELGTVYPVTTINHGVSVAHNTVPHSVSGFKVSNAQDFERYFLKIIHSSYG